jgi:hypothetical protein
MGNASNVATAVTPSGDVTATNAGVFAIGSNKVTDAMFRQSIGLSVVGRSVNSTGNTADINAANDGEVLRRSGTSLGIWNSRYTWDNQSSSHKCKDQRCSLVKNYWNSHDTIRIWNNRCTFYHPGKWQDSPGKRK